MNGLTAFWFKVFGTVLAAAIIGSAAMIFDNRLIIIEMRGDIKAIEKDVDEINDILKAAVLPEMKHGLDAIEKRFNRHNEFHERMLRQDVQ